MNYTRSLEYVESNSIGLDDSFSFACHQCGKCCTNRTDLLLTGPDIYRIASVLGVSAKDIVSQYCEIYIGRDSHIPVCRMKPIGKKKACPLLKEKRCSVHKAKPIVCALFPLGRAINAQEKETIYFLQDVSDHKNGNLYTVREWLMENNVPLNDEASMIWSEIVTFCALFMHDHITKIRPDRLPMIYDLMAMMMYGAYPSNVSLIELMKTKYNFLTNAIPRLAEEYKW